MKTLRAAEAPVKVIPHSTPYEEDVDKIPDKELDIIVTLFESVSYVEQPVTLVVENCRVERYHQHRGRCIIRAIIFNDDDTYYEWSVVETGDSYEINDWVKRRGDLHPLWTY